MSQDLQSLSVFDFDDTLIHGDSMWAFLPFVAGWPRVGIALAEAAVAYAKRRYLNPNDPALADRGTFFKDKILKRLIAGRTPESLADAVARLRPWLRWKESVCATLREHYDNGHHVVIASGSLDLYLPELIKELPHHALLCTNIEVRDGVVTGAMSLGNCVRQGKAERVAAYIATHGPFGESWAYGNFPDDVPMMNLLKHRIIVS
jgi:HAD superfamily hydrolase (TIGR01490 family)